MPTWFIQRIEALAVREVWDISNGDELLFVNRFANKNDFDVDLHNGGISGVAQDDNEQNNDNYDNATSMNEDQDEPPEKYLDPAADNDDISGVTSQKHTVELPGVDSPEEPVELPGVAPPGNEVEDDVVTPIFPSDYRSDDESDDEGECTYTSTQQRQRVIDPEAMPPIVKNVYRMTMSRTMIITIMMPV